MSGLSAEQDQSIKQQTEKLDSLEIVRIVYDEAIQRLVADNTELKAACKEKDAEIKALNLDVDKRKDQITNLTCRVTQLEAYRLCGR